MKVLMTGFEPFGGEKLNPAYEAVLRMKKELDGASVLRLALPVEYGKGADVLHEALLRERPDLVISVGQAGGRSAVTPERIAVNLRDASVPDNAGVLYQESPIVTDGPAAYFSALPVRRIVGRLKEEGIESYVSNSAGLYVCNDVMYLLLHWIYTEFPGMRGGFIHVPYMTQQTAGKEGVPSMPLKSIVRALELSTEISLAQKQ